jgi:hypothetical protein
MTTGERLASLLRKIEFTEKELHRLWGSVGKVIRPDNAHEGDEGVRTHYTHGTDTGWLNRAERLEYGYAQGVPCRCANSPEVYDCLNRFADTVDGKWTYRLYNRTCETFVNAALSHCCLQQEFPSP